MVKSREAVGVKVSSAVEVLHLLEEHEIKHQVPLTDAAQILVSLDVEKAGTQETDQAAALVKTMDDKHAWAIFLDSRLVQKAVVDGKEQHFLIGYENGLSARQNETHFSQKENDPVCHRVIFQPEPTFISYSFFYGFFGKTIEAMCQRYIAANTEWNISVRKQILGDFCDKYTFAFPKNPKLQDTMCEYAEALIENIIDIQAKVGK